MAEPLLTDVFGASAAINAGVLSVDLSEIDPAPSDTSGPEGIVVAGMLALQANQDTDPDSQVAITGPEIAQVTRNGEQTNRLRYSVDVFKLVGGVNPADL